MKKVFLWNNSLQTKKDIEDMLSDVIAERDIQPCHGDLLQIKLNVDGALDEKLEGIIACTCGKLLAQFDSLVHSATLNITEY